MEAVSFRSFERRLLAMRGSDGGFGPRADLPSEPEPTALAAIALDDDDARGWLRDAQRSDGSFDLGIGLVDNDAATSIAAIALGPGLNRELAIDHVLRTPGQALADTPEVPHNAALPGWAWTIGTFGWVEPTARALLALQICRPSAEPAISRAIHTLGDRECVGGGWNYGNRVVLGEDLPPYAQTTAAALIGLQSSAPGLTSRGLSALRTLWKQETSGSLSVAMSVAALRLHGDPEAAHTEAVLNENFVETSFLGDVVATAWAAIATGPGLARLDAAGAA